MFTVLPPVLYWKGVKLVANNLVNYSLTLDKVKKILDSVVDTLVSGDYEPATIDSVTEILVLMDVQLENQLAG